MNQIWLNAVRASAGAAVPWWLAGGAPEPVAVYEPAAAANLADSYIPTIATVGNTTLDPAIAGGVAPTFDAGWVGDGSAQLRTGIVPNANFAALIRFRSASNAAMAFGMSAGGAAQFRIGHSPVNDVIVYAFGVVVDVEPFVADGVFGIAGGRAYRNGVDEGVSLGSYTGTGIEMYILAANGIFARSNATIEYVAIWDTSANHTVWMPAVSAAMAAL